MALRTTGQDINSWVDLNTANMLILEVPASAYAGDSPQQFTTDDIPYIIEAHQQIASSWLFQGQPTDARQRLPFPRTGFPLRSITPTSCWFADAYPHLDASWEPLAHHIAWDLGGSSVDYLASDEVPTEIKEAAVILAMLLKNGRTLYEDNKGDETQSSIGPLSNDNINAVAVASAVFQRMARWGVFVNVAKAGGSRG